MKHSKPRYKLSFFLQTCPGLIPLLKQQVEPVKMTRERAQCFLGPVFGAIGSTNVYGDLLCARPSSKQWGYRNKEERPNPCPPRAKVLVDGH